MVKLINNIMGRFRFNSSCGRYVRRYGWYPKTGVVCIERLLR